MLAILGCYGRFDRPCQFECFLAWDFHLMNLSRMELYMFDDLVICGCSHHETAVTVYLLCHFSSPHPLRCS